MATATGRIFKQADRQGGDACVNGSRIPVWVLDNCRRLGMPDAQILLTARPGAFSECMDDNRCVLVWEKQAGEWRIVLDQCSFSSK
jgi:hypothetical protein